MGLDCPVKPDNEKEGVSWDDKQKDSRNRGILPTLYQTGKKFPCGNYPRTFLNTVYLIFFYYLIYIWN